MSDTATIKTGMKLFRVQGNGRPMYVVAANWNQALEKWKEFIGIENAIPVNEVEELNGIMLVCDENELLQ